MIIDWRRPAISCYLYADLHLVFGYSLSKSPFSIHGMALAGKELGTDVEQWFEPAGAIEYVFFSPYLQPFSRMWIFGGCSYQQHAFSRAMSLGRQGIHGHRYGQTCYTQRVSPGCSNLYAYFAAPVGTNQVAIDNRLR